MSDTFETIKTDLTLAQNILSAMAPYLNLIPGYAVISPYFALIPLIIKAVAQIQQISGVSKAVAIGALTDHITPGAPNAAALSSPPPQSITVENTTTVQTGPGTS
jgi:hypothetical protein